MNSGRFKPKYEFDINFFDVIDTEDKAYWLGFLYADGYVTKGAVMSVFLSEKDIDHLYKMRSSLKSNHAIHTYPCKGAFSKSNSNRSTFTITNKTNYENLVSKGMVPNKTLILTYPSLPPHLDNHFIRGYFDGDGSIYKGSQGPYMSMVGTFDFLTSVKKRMCPMSKSKLYLEKRSKAQVYYISIGGKKMINYIYHYLYDGSQVSMDRKKLKFEELCC